MCHRKKTTRPPLGAPVHAPSENSSDDNLLDTARAFDQDTVADAAHSNLSSLETARQLIATIGRREPAL